MQHALLGCLKHKVVQEVARGGQGLGSNTRVERGRVYVVHGQGRHELLKGRDKGVWEGTARTSEGQGQGGVGGDGTNF